MSKFIITALALLMLAPAAHARNNNWARTETPCWNKCPPVKQKPAGLPNVPSIIHQPSPNDGEYNPPTEARPRSTPDSSYAYSYSYSNSYWWYVPPTRSYTRNSDPFGVHQNGF